MLSILNQPRLWVGLCLGLLGLTACSPPGERAVYQGQAAFEDGRYLEAVKYFQKATSILRTNAQAWNYLGLACQHAGNAADAERAYQAALQHDRDLSEARYNLGCLYLEQGRLEKARSELTAYTLRRPNAAAGWLKLGAIQARLREYLAAEKSYLEASKFEPKNPEVWNSIGLVCLQRSRLPEARQAFESALQAQPGFPPALLNLAVLAHQYLKDRPFALAKYRDYVAVKPTPAHAAEVREIIRQLEQEMAPPPRVQTAAGSRTSPATNAVRGTSSGIRATNAAPAPQVATQPKPPPVERSVVAAQPRTNSPQIITAKTAAPPETVRLPDEVVFRPAEDVRLPTPGTASVSQVEAAPAGATNGPVVAANKAPAKKGFFNRINPLNLIPDKKKSPATNASPAVAASALEKTLPGARYAYLSPPAPAAGNRAAAERVFAQAVQAQQSQKLNEAMQDYRNATQLDPSYFDAYYNLGLVAARTGANMAALRAYEFALAIRPKALDARYNFALLLRQAGYPQDSANEHNLIVAAYPNDSRAHLALGNLYAQQLNQPAKARVHYLKVLETDPRNPQAASIRYWLAAN
jgi:tetratricopeptide (TPR) repeat protein